MTLKRAYKSLIITTVLMMSTIILYALNVSKLNLEWGMVGFSIAAILSIFSVVVNIHAISHKKEVMKPGYLSTRRYEILDWFTFLTVSLMAIFMIFMFFILPSDVSQNSMNPTLLNGDRILIYHFQYEPKKNDIVVIHITKEDYPLVPDDSFEEDGVIHDEVFFVKRIMAVSGDLVEFVNYDDAHETYMVQINGVIAISPQSKVYYVTEEEKEIIEQTLNASILINEYYLTFGDNTTGSLDSRRFGSVQAKDIIGKVVFRLWPLGTVK